MPKLILDDGTEIPIAWANLPAPLDWKITDWQKQVTDQVPNAWVLVCTAATPTEPAPADSGREPPPRT